MIGVIATLRMKEGGGEGFEGLFRQIAAAVKDNEPGNLLYKAFRSRTEPNTYTIMEIYQDEGSRAAHSQSEHFKALVPKMAEFREAGRPEVEYFDGID